MRYNSKSMQRDGCGKRRSTVDGGVIEGGQIREASHRALPENTALGYLNQDPDVAARLGRAFKATTPEDMNRHKVVDRHGAMPTDRERGQAAGRPSTKRGKLKLGKTSKRVGVREGRLEGRARKRNR